MDIYFKLFEVLFPVFFMVGIGYFIGKKNPKLDTSFITNFAANIGSPAMVFYAITTTGVTFSMLLKPRAKALSVEVVRKDSSGVLREVWKESLRVTLDSVG